MVLPASRLLALVVLLVAAACSDDSSTPPGSGPSSTAVDIDPDGSEEGALLWGDGGYGVLLVHARGSDASDWRHVAVDLARAGAAVLAVEDTDADTLIDAVAYLIDEVGAGEVAVIGAGTGADATMQMSARRPGFASSLVLVSPTDVVDGVGESPKLFIATTGDESADVAVRQMERVPDDESELLLLPGSGHGQVLFTGSLRGRVMRAITDWFAPLKIG